MPRRGTKGFVLVVEDDFALRRAVAEALVLAGYRVRSAADGREALLELSLEEQRPCTVVLDLSMPTMTGEELIAQLQAQGLTDTLRIVVITANPSPPPLPVNAILHKPFAMQALLDAVARACA